MKDNNVLRGAKDNPVRGEMRGKGGLSFHTHKTPRQPTVSLSFNLNMPQELAGKASPHSDLYWVSPLGTRHRQTLEEMWLCVSSVRQNQRPRTPPREPFYTWLTPMQYKCDNLQGEKRAGQESVTQGCLNRGTLFQGIQKCWEFG